MMRSAMAVLEVACAAMVFRSDRGAWPAHAAELVPGYLDAVPVDGLWKNHVRLRMNRDGSLSVYSFGADGTDDGGGASGSLDWDALRASRVRRGADFTVTLGAE